MSDTGEIRQYLDNFYSFVLTSAVDSHKRIIDVINIATYVKSRELWCVFVYISHTFESDFEIWEDFWRLITIKRDSFYNRYKKSGLGFVTIYPIFISSDQISALMRHAIP